MNIAQDHNEQPKKRKKWELSEEEKVVILNSCGEAKAAFIRECYSEQASVAQLLKSPILMEVSLLEGEGGPQKKHHQTQIFTTP